MAEIIDVQSTEEFDRLIGEAKVPVVVDFWAAWCGPCRQLAPILHQLAEDAGPRMQLLKVNVDEHQDLAARYGIRSIPCVIRFDGGQEAKRMVGAMPRAQVERQLGLTVGVSN